MVTRRIAAVLVLASLIGAFSFSLSTPSRAAVDPIQDIGFIRTKYNAGLAAATASDTVQGPHVKIENARRITFYITNVRGNADSTATIYVANKDTVDAGNNQLGAVDANGLPGLQVIDNISSNFFGDSIGGRTIELVKIGPGRIDWKVCWPAIRGKCCLPGKLENVKFTWKTES